MSTLGSFLGIFGEEMDNKGLISIISLKLKNLKNPFKEAIFLVMEDGVNSFLFKDLI